MTSLGKVFDFIDIVKTPNQEQQGPDGSTFVGSSQIQISGFYGELYRDAAGQMIVVFRSTEPGRNDWVDTNIPAALSNSAPDSYLQAANFLAQARVQFEAVTGQLPTGTLAIGHSMGGGMDRSDRFLRKLGFRQTGGNYVLEGLGG
jgi:hypothetical protein